MPAPAALVNLSVPDGLWQIRENLTSTALMKPRPKANLPAYGRGHFMHRKTGATLSVAATILQSNGQLFPKAAAFLILAHGLNKMTEYKKIFKCLTENDTKKLACCFSNVAQKGDIFALYGTLGAGKSTFSRFFIQNLSDAQEVPSPTFTLVQSYEGNDFEIYHYDMYRLKSPEEAYELGIEESFYNGVNLIEWPEKIGYLLPKNIWTVNIFTKDSARYFEVTVSDEEKKKRLEKLGYGD